MSYWELLDYILSHKSDTRVAKAFKSAAFDAFMLSA